MTVETENSTGKDHGLPGYWRFAWMFFMQPISLHRLLKDAGIENPDEPGRRLFLKALKGEKESSAYLKRLAFILLALMPAVAFSVTAAAHALGAKVRWKEIVYGLAYGLAVGLAVGMTYRVAIGVAGGVAIGVALGVALGMSSGVALFVVGGVAIGVTSGVASGAAVSLAVGVAGGVVEGVSNGLALGMIAGVAAGMTGGMAEGVTCSVAVSLSFLFFFFRIPFWILETGLWILSGQMLRRVPALLHELTYLPIPGLGNTLLGEARAHPAHVAQLLDICEAVPGQQRTVAKVHAKLIVRSLKRAGEEGGWLHAALLQRDWLPVEATAPPVVLVFRDAASEVWAASQSEASVQRRLERLQAALKHLEGSSLFSFTLLSFGDWGKFSAGQLGKRKIEELHHLAPELARHWRLLIEPLLKAAEQEAARNVPNPFTNTGLSLDPNSGRASERETFRGREHCIQQVADALEQPQISMAVIGPRRAGKSSLVKMMPVFLPSDLFVMVDLQGGAGASAEAFYAALDTELAETLRRRGNSPLPRLGNRRDAAGVGEWITELEKTADQRRVVFCIDEYERLEAMWAGDERSLIQLLGLIRYTIQHRKRVRFLIAGASPLADMPPLWTDHFISAREIRVDFLEHGAVIDLLLKPTANFPDDAVSSEVAEAIWELTAGQPHLVQCYGFRVLQRINAEERKVVTLEDVEAVRERIVTDNSNYFADYRNGPEAARQALEALATGQAPEWKPGARHWLRTRGYLTRDDRIRVPLFEMWLRGYLKERE